MKKRRRITSRNLVCAYCQSGKEPDYKAVEELRPFITDRGKIISRGRTGNCAKHQRKLSVAIKRARHLALIPFVIKV